MGHVFDFKEAIAYEQWLQKPQAKAALALETRLMQTLLQPMRGESVLDIGCGTGVATAALLLAWALALFAAQRRRERGAGVGSSCDRRDRRRVGTRREVAGSCGLSGLVTESRLRARFRADRRQPGILRSG